MINGLYVPGVMFYRCGVCAIELGSVIFKQPDLFAPNLNNPELMSCYDKINQSTLWRWYG